VRFVQGREICPGAWVTRRDNQSVNTYRQYAPLALLGANSGTTPSGCSTPLPPPLPCDPTPYILATMHACTPPILTPLTTHGGGFPAPPSTFRASHLTRYRLSSIVALPSSMRSDNVRNLLRCWNSGLRKP